MAYRLRLKPKLGADQRPCRRLLAADTPPTPFETPPGA